MKVVGFTFIRNAVKYDYPVVEAIQSILPICDEFVVAVGASEDNTVALIESIHPQKIKIIPTVWDDSLREGGAVLAKETNKAFQAISDDADWCFYIQGDEVVHERYLPEIRKSMERELTNKKLDGLLFKYLHFYGSYNYIGTSSNWYRNEIRIIRNNKAIYSYRDAQGFRKGKNEKLRVKTIDAYIYHYGWVKDPRAMQLKQQDFNKLWHDDAWVEKYVAKAEEFDYSCIDSLAKFTLSHPAVMQQRIAKKNWEFNYDITRNKIKLKSKLKNLAYNWFGWEIGYKNYIKI